MCVCVCVCAPQVGTKVPEVTDGSCLSRQPIADGQQPQRAGPPGNTAAPATVGQLAASLAGVHSEHRHLILLYFILLQLSLYQISKVKERLCKKKIINHKNDLTKKSEKLKRP